MQPQVSQIEKLRKDFAQFQNILIISSPKGDFDSFAASLAIYLSLSKKRKNVSIVSSREPSVEFSNLVGVDKIKTEIPSGKFIITLGDVLGNVDKVTHYLEDGQLNIVVHPLPGSPPFSKEKVFFRSGEADFEKIILVGVTDLNLLGSLYTQNRNIYSKVPILAIGNALRNQEINHEVFERKEHSSLSEVTAIFLNKLGLPIDEDTAENLFLGIANATENFQSPKASADAFEAAAFCLRCGAKRSIVACQLEDSKTKDFYDKSPKKFELKNENDPLKYQLVKKMEDQDFAGEDEKPDEDWLTPPKIYRSSKSS